MVTTLLLFFKGVNNNDIDSSQRPNPAPLHWPNNALESATLDQISSIRSLTPPLIFGKLCFNFFIMYMVEYM